MEIVISLVLVLIGAAVCYFIIWYTEFKPETDYFTGIDEGLKKTEPLFVIIKNTDQIKFGTLKPGIINHRKYR